MINSSVSLQIVEIFLSIQGETSFTGLPTTFIRLAACNLRCTWCDTSYSFGKGETRKIEEIVLETEANGYPHVCITGGEPLLQDGVYPLMEELCNRGFRLSVETGGSLSTSRIDPRVKVILDVKCPGSGMEDKNRWANIPHIRSTDEVKFVLSDRNDYDYAKAACKKYRIFERTENVLFSPVHDTLESKTLVEWILADKFPVRLNLQIHKWIWNPATRGV